MFLQPFLPASCCIRAGRTGPRGGVVHDPLGRTGASAGVAGTGRCANEGQGVSSDVMSGGIFVFKGRKNATRLQREHAQIYACFAGQRSRLLRNVEHSKTGGSLCRGFGLFETYPFAPSDLPFFEGGEE